MENSKNNNTQKKRAYELWLVIVPLGAIAALSVWFLLQPEQSVASLTNFGSFFVSKTGWFFMITPLILIILSLQWAFSKKGKIRMGGPEAKATYPLWSYIGMLFCASLAGGSCIFSMVEWSYYYAAPPFGIEPLSIEAAKWSIPFNMFHWGITPASLYLLLAIPFCYMFYVRKHQTLKLGNMVGIMIGDKPYRTPVTKIVNLIFVIVIVGGFACTLGLGIPNVANCLMAVFGFKNELVVSIVITVVISLIFSFSSYLGLSKGMSKLSTINIVWAFAFLAVILVSGSTIFTLENSITSVGKMLNEFLTMATNLDAIGQSGFAQVWTIFFYSYSWAYVAVIAVLIVRISYGRTFREMIFSVLLGVPAGAWVLMGINGSNSLDYQLSGRLDVASIVTNEGNHAAVVSILGETIMGPVIGVLAFAIMIIMFLATSLDSASLSLAEATTLDSENGKEPAPILRLVWCVILAVIPLIMTAVGADLNALQAFVNVACWPILIVGIYMWGKTIKWAKEDQPTIEQITPAQKEH
ncbi:MAG: hypothetical protein HFE75_11000 [Firmicutes bacterium]|nr:hypothetical protein [Bacillota bacterium]NBI64284.1 hypothetical protein [Clostridiales bacterium]